MHVDDHQAKHGRSAASRTYALGRTTDEFKRLERQDMYYRELTETFLLRAGLAPGMRVPDIGGGDVALMAARLAIAFRSVCCHRNASFLLKSMTSRERIAGCSPRRFALRILQHRSFDRRQSRGDSVMGWPFITACFTIFVLSLGHVGHASDLPPKLVDPSRAVQQPASVRSTLAADERMSASDAPSPAKADTWIVPDIDALPDDEWGKIVRFGRALTVSTYAYIGPEVADPAKRFAGSNMSCQNCHLEAGTKKFGLPFVGVFADFPEYRPREGEVGTLEERINGCMTRSVNGRALPIGSYEMKAFVAYIKFLSTGRPIGAKTLGRGSGQITELSRPADPVAGAKVFAQACAACHGDDGQGKRAGIVGDARGYEFPPLWGSDSFNNGAGMGRLISAANFIHSNMPNGTTYDQPVLSVDEAWDVAAYVESMKRPQKAGLDKDFPVRTEKPVDAGYGPYIDGFSQDQHKFGPFQPIRNELKAMKTPTAAEKNKPAIQ